MGDEITKVELQAMIEVQGKAASQMEKVAGSLHMIANGQEKGQENLRVIGRDITFIKWVVTSSAALVAIATVIMKLMEGH